MANPDVEVITDRDAMRAFTREQRRQGKTVGFVPTMGYLHDGHVSLVRAARERCDVVVASIYVNPTQFSANEDFGVYPRREAEDLARLREAGCAAAFTPASLYHAPAGAAAGAPSSNAAMVVGAREGEGAGEGDPDAHETWVEVERLSRGLCARSRPHFFRGVCTVVAKLFHIVEPDVAFFGRKDYQQLRVIERMVRDLDFGVEVVGMPIVREADGLAMSSRNAMLTPEHRSKAPCIHAALSAARQGALAGGPTSAAALREAIGARIAEAGGRVDYVEVVDARSLRPVEEVGGQESLVAVAAFFGSVRLIDNIEIAAPEGGAA